MVAPIWGTPAGSLIEPASSPDSLKDEAATHGPLVHRNPANKLAARPNFLAFIRGPSIPADNLVYRKRSGRGQSLIPVPVRNFHLKRILSWLQTLQGENLLDCSLVRGGVVDFRNFFSEFENLLIVAVLDYFVFDGAV